MNGAQLAVCTRVIEETARRYCRRVWWAEELDLRQEAWAEVLSTLARWKAQGRELDDAKLPGLVATISMRTMSASLWAMSSPCSGGAHSKDRAERLGRQQRLEIHFEVGGVAAQGGAPERRKKDRGPVLAIPAEQQPEAQYLEAEALAEVERLRDELHARLTELYVGLLGKVRRAERPRMLFEAVCRVLLDGKAPAESWAGLGEKGEEPPEANVIWTETKLVKKLILEDDECRKLLVELGLWRDELAA